jgi:hypothetical protein
MSNFVAIRSQAFSGNYLSVDGTGVTAPTGPGGGTVSVSKTVSPRERFLLEKRWDGTVAIRSCAYDNVYIRMIADINAPSGPGGGTVNLQYTAGPREAFRLVPQSDGTQTIESVYSPGRFLRMQGIDSAQPKGVVNVQFGAGPWEKFFIAPA